MRRPEVKHTQEFERVRDLPRRQLSQADAEAWARELTPIFAKHAGAKLRPWQAFALAEAVECGGCFFGAPVGLGKTLFFELLPALLGCESEAILITSASLRNKTYKDRADLARDWHLSSPPAQIVSRQELGPESGADTLERLAPRLIMIDEAHRFANPDAAAARRVDRYVVAHPETIVVCATGTPLRNTLMALQHLLCWCLGDGAPIPLSDGEAMMWAAALDEKHPGRAGQRPGPGPLGHNIEAAREWYGRRLQETPGVVMIDGDSAADVPISVRTRYARECPKIDGHYELFLKKGETPGGEFVSDPLSTWRLDGQLGCGLYQRYNPPPPIQWRMARRELCQFVREEIQSSGRTSRPLDTEGQVMRAYPDAEQVETWREVKPTFIPVTEAVWLSSASLESAIDWLEEVETEGEPGIVWCGGVEFAHALATATGLSYYASMGKDGNGRGLERAPPGQSMIVSWVANMEGFNLQPWRRQLIVHPPQSAAYLEQVIGRSHRAGQDQHVIVEILLTSGGTLDMLDSALREARFSKSQSGLTQKLLRAALDFAPRPPHTATNHYRWARRGDIEREKKVENDGAKRKRR